MNSNLVAHLKDLVKAGVAPSQRPARLGSFTLPFHLRKQDPVFGMLW